ncbi:hypothetical protein AGABI1DRAFT_115455 [Agaricus bisporus var. burnettii JB137-S8]|uniref:Uncharacterized protein n=1 Tax=Agaricus bisporus var. burnettii (strain JB137-S8 / ATCC MYA-4627 / FGSC 10392) TaxID=597362 RepID=K5WNY2_AGABU|nr:uncharacterized protein AGABI1DRAFT_115455 [Agaricus bisporus var. burnettii JB137-S8]EKM77036.1 hypothetical protein AGABI1DRAFT_115455 [Agaricus bisporus var. burnettii JB137-S8]
MFLYSSLHSHFHATISFNGPKHTTYRLIRMNGIYARMPGRKSSSGGLRKAGAARRQFIMTVVRQRGVW